jgi:hypothetical protein
MKSGGKIDRAAMAAIGKAMRAVYGDVIAEGVPERFAEILHRLDDPGETLKLETLTAMANGERN